MGVLIEGGKDWMSTGEFFAPASTDLVDGLMGRYRALRAKIEHMAAVVAGEDCAGALDHFVRGNHIEGRHVAATRIFELEGAVASLNASFWQQAINMTDVLDAMPQARRTEWHTAIGNMTTPEFEEQTVRATLQDLLLSRSRFFAERVDGLFRALSGDHVTNAPMGFGKRMILQGITSMYYSTERAGYINDLRAVIAKFMGRDEPNWNATGAVTTEARRRRGEWLSVDGGALRIRCYANGNAHLEVHPDMAWRLNCILAQLHPNAIPSEFRQKPRKVPKDFPLIQRPLPFAVVSSLAELAPAMRFEKTDDWRNPHRREPIRHAAQFPFNANIGAARNEAERVLVSIGGVLQKGGYWQFDYDPMPVITEIVCSGCLPDVKTHQFYPTPAHIAADAVDLAQIGPGDTCLEPSAGQGGLADLMPKERTHCVEVSELHCRILEAKGHSVTRADFLQWRVRTFDRIVLNPPFSEGRWQAHLAHAATLLKPGGRLVAILPASAKGKDVLPGWTCEWPRTYRNEFAGTSVDVVVLVAHQAGAD